MSGTPTGTASAASGSVAAIIDGAAIAKAIRAEVKHDVDELIARGVRPGLTVVQVGEDPASSVYVKAKGKQTAEAGMVSDTIRLPAATAQSELLDVVDRLNHDPAVHGILVQMPPPKHIDPLAVIRALGDAIGYVHAKDARVEPYNLAVQGSLDLQPGKPVRELVWAYRTLGYGHGTLFWADFVSALRSVGYDGVLSIEHEDPLMDAEEAIGRAVALLKSTADQ